MPNRMIKESIRTSRNVNALNDFQFRLWLYLITYVDDFGRGSADPELLKGMVFPRRKGITESQIRDGLDVLANTGMVVLYDVDGEPYLYFPNWANHQRIQTKQSKFPDPAEGKIISRCSTVTHGDSPLETKPKRNQVEEETELETKPKIARAGDFDRFWSVYPKKVGKVDAQKAFAKVNIPVETLISAVEMQMKSDQWVRDAGRYIPNPSTWLNQGRWDDELPEAANRSAGFSCNKKDMSKLHQYSAAEHREANDDLEALRKKYDV